MIGRRYIYLLFLFIISTFLYSCKSKDKSDITVSKHILIDVNGNPIPLPKDKLIVINFLAYTCSSCMKEIPEMKKVMTQSPYKDRFVIIGMVIDSEKGDKRDPLFPIYPNNRANFVRFPVSGTPTTYIITPKGKKLVIIFGAVNEKRFKKFLDEAWSKWKNKE